MTAGSKIVLQLKTYFGTMKRTNLSVKASRLNLGQRLFFSENRSEFPDDLFLNSDALKLQVLTSLQDSQVNII